MAVRTARILTDRNAANRCNFRRHLGRWQDAATPQALSAAVLDWFAARQHQPERISALHHSLRRNTPQLAADAIRKVLTA